MDDCNNEALHKGKAHKQISHLQNGLEIACLFICLSIFKWEHFIYIPIKKSLNEPIVIGYS